MTVDRSSTYKMLHDTEAGQQPSIIGRRLSTQ